MAKKKRNNGSGLEGQRTSIGGNRQRYTGGAEEHTRENITNARDGGIDYKVYIAEGHDYVGQTEELLRDELENEE